MLGGCSRSVQARLEWLFPLVSRFTTICAPIGLLASPAASQANGMWHGPWDWTCQVLGYGPGPGCPANPPQVMCDPGTPPAPPPPSGPPFPAPDGPIVYGTGVRCPLLEFAHAALIPTGPHRGKILMWRNATLWCCTGPSGRTTESWLFEPPPMVLPPPQPPSAIPALDLIKVEQAAPLDANLFCSGHTWDTGGRLVVGGGPTFSPGTFARSTYRFLPGSLGAVSMVGGYPTISVANQSGPVWAQLGDFASPHWYPTLLALNLEPIPMALPNDPVCTSLGPTPGSTVLAFGGAFDQTANRCPPGTLCVNCDWCYLGHSTWERLVAGEWRCPLVPSNNPDPEQLSAPVPTESYTESPVPPPPSGNLNGTYRYIDSYPRAFQLSDFAQKQVFVAFDTSSGVGDLNTTTPNSSWSMLIPYASATQPPVPNWSLYEGQSLSNVGTGDGDRLYGNAVVLHNRLQKDRIIVLNGLQPELPAGAQVNQTLQEMQSTGNPALNATWAVRAILGSGGPGQANARYYANAVVLPTGQILVLGGQTATNCELRPLLIDVGEKFTDPTVVTELNASSLPTPAPGRPRRGSITPSQRCSLMAGCSWLGATTTTVRVQPREFSPPRTQASCSTLPICSPALARTSTTRRLRCASARRAPAPWSSRWLAPARQFQRESFCCDPPP